MTGTVLEKGKGTFNWIYDCGSKSSNAMTNALGRAAAWPEWSDSINMLTLSHFDDDHVNGLEDLLKKHNVDCLVLPFSEWQQRVRDVASGGLKGVSASTTLLQLSPVTWLQSKNLAEKVKTLLLVKGGDSEKQNDQAPMPLPTGPKPNELDGDRLRQDNLEQLDLSMITSADAGAPSVQVIQHGTPIQPAGFPIEFIFYNAEVSGKGLGIIEETKTGDLISKKSKLPLQDVRKAIEAEISKLGLDKPFSSLPPDWRAKLKKCYETHFGSTNTARNNISLCMYVGPASITQDLHPCRLFRDRDVPHPIVDMVDRSALYPDRPAVLCTGDLRIDANVILAMQSHFQKRWNRIGVTQVPHHGSEHSWASGNAKLLAPSAFVHCAPGKGAHPHKDVVADLSNHAVFIADYKNSVGLKYHFAAP